MTAPVDQSFGACPSIKELRRSRSCRTLSDFIWRARTFLTCRSARQRSGACPSPRGPGGHPSCSTPPTMGAPSRTSSSPGTRRRTPVAGWKALAKDLLTDQSCAFHHNVEISARYAWIYRHLPACFKWAGMAAIASHHVRLALFPLRLDTNRTGYVDIPRSLGRRRVLLLEDVNTIRATNNAIFDDIFWVPRLPHRRRRHRTPARPPGSGAPLRPHPDRLRGDRPWTPCPGRRRGVHAGPAGGRGPRLGGQRRAPRARAARPGPTPLRPTLLRVRPAHLTGRGHDLRGARRAEGDRVLHLVLLLLAHARAPRRPARPDVAGHGRESPASTTAGDGS
jgi:hypothetical protein